jgi:hypothetical protein
MTDETRDPTCLSPNTSHAVEVRRAQADADEVRAGCHATSAPGADAAADLKLLRGLVAAYGVDGVRRMIDSLK